MWDYEDDFGIWSCKFSADGNEVIAGGSSMIFGSYPSSVNYAVVSNLMFDSIRSRRGPAYQIGRAHV